MNEALVLHVAVIYTVRVSTPQAQFLSDRSAF
jgi:hypothetical protein